MKPRIVTYKPDNIEDELERIADEFSYRENIRIEYEL